MHGPHSCVTRWGRDDRGFHVGYRRDLKEASGELARERTGCSSHPAPLVRRQAGSHGRRRTRSSRTRPHGSRQGPLLISSSGRRPVREGRRTGTTRCSASATSRACPRSPFITSSWAWPSARSPWARTSTASCRGGSSTIAPPNRCLHGLSRALLRRELKPTP